MHNPYIYCSVLSFLPVRTYIALAPNFFPLLSKHMHIPACRFHWSPTGFYSGRFKNHRINLHLSENSLNKILRAQKKETVVRNGHTVLVVWSLNEELGINKRSSPAETKEVFAGRKTVHEDDDGHPHSYAFNFLLIQRAIFTSNIIHHVLGFLKKLPFFL